MSGVSVGTEAEMVEEALRRASWSGIGLPAHARRVPSMERVGVSDAEIHRSVLPAGDRGLVLER